jgi:uncharacterized SAM-binding protein YcdF (DUF218 family)
MAFVWLALMGMLISQKKKTLGQIICYSSLVLTLILSTPFVSSRLAVFLQDDSIATTDTTAQAIVILGGGGASLERVRFGAALAKKTGLPILVSSGDPFHEGVTEATIMQEMLRNDFGISAQWLEDQSKDTAENAKFSFALLTKENISRVYLVTHALHMPRARYLFEQAGLTVIPAPTGIVSPKKFSWNNLLPTAGAFEESSLIFREIIGGIWAQRIVRR